MVLCFRINDRVISANSVSLEGVDYATAVQVIHIFFYNITCPLSTQLSILNAILFFLQIRYYETQDTQSTLLSRGELSFPLHLNPKLSKSLCTKTKRKKVGKYVFVIVKNFNLKHLEHSI